MTTQWAGVGVIKPAYDVLKAEGVVAWCSDGTMEGSVTDATRWVFDAFKLWDGGEKAGKNMEKSWSGHFPSVARTSFVL